MPSATQAARSRSGDGGGTLLKGTSLGKSKEVEVLILKTREAPTNFNSALIVDISPVFNCQAFPLNKTNTGILVAELGDNYDKWAGHKITLTKVQQRNPQTNQATWGLSITAVSKKTFSTAKYARPDDDDVPF